MAVAIVMACEICGSNSTTTGWLQSGNASDFKRFVFALKEIRR